MHVIPDTPLVAFDLDNTLLMWDYDADKASIEITIDNIAHNFNTHCYHIGELKKHKARGHTIVCWSAGGSKWVKAAIKALQLEEYVDIVMPKPSWYYDDIMPNEFMGKNLFKEEE